MATPIEAGVLVLAVVALIGAFTILRAAAALAVNAVAGLLVLIVANALGAGVQISLVAVLVCAVAGVPGAILVVLLASLDVAFATAVLPLLA